MLFVYNLHQHCKIRILEGMAELEIKKMKQGMSYSCKEKTIILNVFKYFRSQFPEKCVTEIVRRTAKATGCSEKSIFQFRKEEASVEGFKVPSTTKIRRNININSRDIKYDDSVRQAIRTVIYDLKYKNIVPSLSTIVKQVNSNPNLPNFSLMTLRRLMFDMGFCYEKNGNKSILTEKSEPTSGKKESKKENIPNKVTRKQPKPKQLAQEVAIPSRTSQIINQPQSEHIQPMPQNHRFLPMHHEYTHNMPVMFNHRMPPSNVHEMPPWMHHHPPPHALLKQE